MKEESFQQISYYNYFTFCIVVEKEKVSSINGNIKHEYKPHTKKKKKFLMFLTSMPSVNNTYFLYIHQKDSVLSAMGDKTLKVYLFPFKRINTDWGLNHVYNRELWMHSDTQSVCKTTRKSSALSDTRKEPLEVECPWDPQSGELEINLEMSRIQTEWRYVVGAIWRRFLARGTGVTKTNKV